MRSKLIAYRGNRSQAEMAKLYKVTQQSWSNWENGHGIPRSKTMFQIAKDAGLSIEELFFDDKNKQTLLKDRPPGGDAA